MNVARFTPAAGAGVNPVGSAGIDPEASTVGSQPLGQLPQGSTTRSRSYRRHELSGFRAFAVAGALFGLLGATGIGAPVAHAQTIDAIPPAHVLVVDTNPAPAPSAQPVPISWTNAPLSSETGKARTASNAAAQNDLDRINGLRPAIMAAAASQGIDPALLAGLISRESQAGAGLDANGIGDHGKGYGLTQINHNDYASLLASHDWRDPQTNMELAARILKSNRTELERKAAHAHLSPTESEILTWTLSSYNAGPGGAFRGVVRHHNSDTRTTDHNYARDVLARAEFFRAQGFKF